MSGTDLLQARLSQAFDSSGPRHAANTLLNLTERRLGRERVLSQPVTVQAEVTTRCNLNCIMCSRWCAPFPGRDLREDVMGAVLELSSRSRELVLFGYGEPLIARSFYRMLAGAKSARLSFITNGLILDRPTAELILSQASRPLYTITFSIDAATAQTYNSIRERSDFARVWGNLSQLVALTSRSERPHVWIDFVAMRRNISELASLVEIAADAGVDRINVFNVVVWDASYSDESLIYHAPLAKEAFAEAERTALARGIQLCLPAVPESGAEQSSAVPACFDPWSYVYIRQDGGVQACCFADEYIMGNLSEEPFSSIWNNDAYRALRASVNSSTAPAACRRCEQRWRKVNSPADSEVYLRLRPRISP
jgi:radical SAM protein with 4Fe4S-binding SPASM domain